MFDYVNNKREALIVSILGAAFFIVSIYMLKNEISFKILNLAVSYTHLTLPTKRIV